MRNDRIFLKYYPHFISSFCTCLHHSDNHNSFNSYSFFCQIISIQQCCEEMSSALRFQETVAQKLFLINCWQLTNITASDNTHTHSQNVFCLSCTRYHCSVISYFLKTHWCLLRNVSILVSGNCWEVAQKRFQNIHFFGHELKFFLVIYVLSSVPVFKSHQRSIIPCLSLC